VAKAFKEVDWRIILPEIRKIIKEELVVRERRT